MAGYCDAHRKLVFTRKREAKKAARLADPKVRMSVYHCSTNPGYHIGHLATDVRRGLRLGPRG